MKYFTKDDLAKLLPVIRTHSQRDHLIALIGITTGARISQILALKGEDIFEINGRLVIKIGRAKNGNDGLHTLRTDSNPDLDLSPLVQLAKQRRTSLLFGGAYRSNFNTALKSYCAEANIHSDYAHSHVFRHTCAMIIWEGTQRIGAITQALQHKSAATALIYLAENDGKLGQAALDAFAL